MIPAFTRYPLPCFLRRQLWVVVGDSGMSINVSSYQYPSPSDEEEAHQIKKFCMPHMTKRTL